MVLRGEILALISPALNYLKLIGVNVAPTYQLGAAIRPHLQIGSIITLRRTISFREGCCSARVAAILSNLPTRLISFPSETARLHSGLC